MSEVAERVKAIIVDKLSVEEQEQITKDVLNFVEIEGNSMDRTVMRTVIQRLSPSEVKRIVYSNDPVGTLAGMLPLVGDVYSAIKYFSNDTFLSSLFRCTQQIP